MAGFDTPRTMGKKLKELSALMESKSFDTYNEWVEGKLPKPVELSGDQDFDTDS